MSLSKINKRYFSPNQTDQQTSHPSEVSELTENAIGCSLKAISINNRHQTDLLHKQQLHISESSTHLCRNHENKSTTPIACESENERWRRERYGFHLDPDIPPNTAVDTHYHGSVFIADWLLSFTNGELKLTFDRIFNPLVDGIRKEGQEIAEPCVIEIIDFLYTIKNEKPKMRNSKRTQKLEEACAKLYTRQSFLFGLVNRTLRDDDRSKLTSLGPYCYLVYNYIGSRVVDYLSIRHRIRQQIQPTESNSIIVYRGDHVTNERIEEYRRAAGEKDKYFKWLSFVSTSLDEDVAKRFGQNILYEIELCRYTSNDQFVNLEKISFYKHEKEVLLRSGVRFRVDRVNFDKELNRDRVYIRIVPSYALNLR